MGSNSSRPRSRAPLANIENKKPALARAEGKPRSDSDTTLHTKEAPKTAIQKAPTAVQKKLNKDFLWGFATGERPRDQCPKLLLILPISVIPN